MSSSASEVYCKDNICQPPQLSGPGKTGRGSAGEATMHPTVKKVKRIIIGVAGGTVLLLGIVMIVLPGPAVVVIPVGLAILASEFVWARRLLRKVRAKIEEISGDRRQ